MFFFFLDPHDAPVFSHGLKAFEHGLDLLREVDSKMTVGAAASFVHIARRLPSLYGGSVSMADVAKEMSINYATFMRSADVMSEGGANTRSLNLLEAGMFPGNKRAKQFRLTPSGLELLRNIDLVVSTEAKKSYLTRDEEPGDRES
jgi:DNA-binding MarR family transcriptional regulator